MIMAIIMGLMVFITMTIGMGLVIISEWFFGILSIAISILIFRKI